MFDFFRGNWQFERTVTSPNITMRGQAIFKPCNASILRYEERASYELKEEALQCHQVFFYKIAGDTLQIEKEDRTLLHEFLLSREVSFPLTLEHEHLCREDLYQIRLMLHTPQVFETYYTIRGPSKDYRMMTPSPRRGKMRFHTRTFEEKSCFRIPCLHFKFFYDIKRST